MRPIFLCFSHYFFLLFVLSLSLPFSFFKLKKKTYFQRQMFYNLWNWPTWHTQHSSFPCCSAGLTPLGEDACQSEDDKPSSNCIWNLWKSCFCATSLHCEAHNMCLDFSDRICGTCFSVTASCTGSVLGRDRIGLNLTPVRSQLIRFHIARVGLVVGPLKWPI